MTIEELMQKKRETGLSNEQIAELSRVPLSTVQKVMSGNTKSPRYKTVEALSGVFEKKTYLRHPREASMVREPANGYALKAQQLRKTVEDYYKLPEERRVELIDGVFYDMAAPTSNHQVIQSYLAADFIQFVRENKGSCMILVSPIDVQLDKDSYTMVQPDILINCDPEKNINRCIYGAPDLIAEILSPSSLKRDCIVKLAKYQNAGVREYWMLDPFQKKVYVYDFADNHYPLVYDFHEDIPVNIWGGKLKINLSYLDNLLI